MSFKTKFDPDLAVLPIFVAQWGDDPAGATISYQNNVLRDEIGAWEGVEFLKLLDMISHGHGKENLSNLISRGSLVLGGTISGFELKLHSRMGPSHFQMVISDNTELNAARDREQRTSLINSFLNLGSHELKTPLNGILGLAELLVMNESDPEKLELLEMIRESGRILDGTVSRMLTTIYADGDEQIVQEDDGPLDLSKCIQSKYSLLEKHLQGLEFSRESLHLESTLMAGISEQHFLDILTEVAINLRRNTPPGKRVEIFTIDENDTVHMIVENECQGIPPRDWDRVFDPLYRFQDASQHTSGFEYGQGGIGMGLTVLKKIMDRISARVWFENRDEYSVGQENLVRMHLVFPVPG